VKDFGLDSRFSSQKDAVGQKEEHRPRWRARAVTCAMTVLFGVQLWYVTVAGEPYPAIMMPRFSWAGPTEASGVDIPVPEIGMVYADGTTRKLTQGNLFPGISAGHHSGLMASLLSLPPEPAASEGQRYRPPTWLFPGFKLAESARKSPERAASLRDWLTKRGQEQYAGARPVRCVVEWYDDHYPYDPRRDPTQARASHTLLGTVQVDL
jgi:hypothetical protein